MAKRSRLVAIACLAIFGFSGPAVAEPSHTVRRELPNALTDAATEHCLLPIVDVIYEKERLIEQGSVDGITLTAMKATTAIMRKTKWNTRAPDGEFREIRKKAEAIIAEKSGRLEPALAQLRLSRRKARDTCARLGEKNIACVFAREAESHRAGAVDLLRDSVSTQKGYRDYAACVLEVRGR